MDEGALIVNMQVVALVPATAIAGPTTERDSLVSGMFTVTILPAEKINICEGNQLWVGDLSEVDSQPRHHKVTFQIPTIDEEADPFRVAAKEVFSAKGKEDCPTFTYSQWFDYETNEWVDTRSDDRKEVNMEEGMKYVDLSFD
jgi:hypothetical protein